MPLHTYNPVGIASPFDAFNGPVGSTSGHAQVLPGSINRLMMAAIDACLRAAIEFGETASELDLRRVFGIPLALLRRQIRVSVGERVRILGADVLN